MTNSAIKRKNILTYYASGRKVIYTNTMKQATQNREEKIFLTKKELRNIGFKAFEAGIDFAEEIKREADRLPIRPNEKHSTPTKKPA